LTTKLRFARFARCFPRKRAHGPISHKTNRKSEKVKSLEIGNWKFELFVFTVLLLYVCGFSFSVHLSSAVLNILYTTVLKLNNDKSQNYKQ